jgi:hypothetical protein
MPISSKLLWRAYQFAESGDHENVARLLDAILESDPKNIEAWEFYLQTCTCIDELDHVADRVQQTKNLSEDEKGDILDYYLYRLDKFEENAPRPEQLPEIGAVDPFIVPNDLADFEENQSQPSLRKKPQFTWISSKNVIPLTIILLIVTYILDKTIPNNGLIGFFIVLALSFLYIYWLSTNGVIRLPSTNSRTYAKDFGQFEDNSRLYEDDIDLDL